MLPSKTAFPQDNFRRRLLFRLTVLPYLSAAFPQMKSRLASVRDFYIITIMPKKIDHDARRRDIARAAISVIGEQGIDNTRLIDVARAANATTGTITHYFEDKDAVLLAALDHVSQNILAMLRTPEKPEDLVELTRLILPVDEANMRDRRVWMSFLQPRHRRPRPRPHQQGLLRRIPRRSCLQSFATSSATGASPLISIPPSPATRSFPSSTASASARRSNARNGRLNASARSSKPCSARSCRNQRSAAPEREDRMPKLETLPATASPDEILAVLKRDGALILKDVLTKDQIAQVLTETMPYIDATEPGRDDFTGRKTTRTGALVARSAACRDMVANKTIVAAAESFLKPFCERIQLHLTQVIRIRPGQPKQQIHRDRWAWGTYLKNLEPQFNTIWAITDFTKENGATQVCPGSLDWADDYQPTDDQIGYAEMSAGSVLVYSGGVFHGGGAERVER